MFLPGGDAGPTTLHADQRVFGRPLHTGICASLGLQAEEWDCRRLLETVPNFPVEQYVLSPLSLRWDHMHIPVDLRPINSRVVVVDAVRSQPCGLIVEQALQQVGIRADSRCFLCRTGDGWFLPSAYVTLLPRGDSFQVWPLARVPSLQYMVPSSSPATVEDRFAVSAVVPAPTDEDFQAAAAYNSVVISDMGLFYVHAPTYAEHTAIRAAVLSDYRDQHPGLGSLQFLRLLPPLARLPPIQFVASPAGSDDEPTVVDVRPIGGGIVVFSGTRGDTPVDRIHAATRLSGEPIPDQSLVRLITAGHLRVMHREAMVDPNVALTTDPPVALVVSTINGPGDEEGQSNSQASHTIALPVRAPDGQSSCHLTTPGSLLCGLLGLRFRFGAALCWTRVLLRGILSVQIDEVEWVTFHPEQASEPSDPRANIATIAVHRRLAGTLYAQADHRPIRGPLTTGAISDRQQVLGVELWSPSSCLRALFPDSVSSQEVRAKVKQASVLPRGTPVLGAAASRCPKRPVCISDA